MNGQSMTEEAIRNILSAHLMQCLAFPVPVRFLFQRGITDHTPSKSIATFRNTTLDGGRPSLF